LIASLSASDRNDGVAVHFAGVAHQPSWSKLQASQVGPTVQIKITNSSQDISAGDRERLCDRFHRGDLARTRQVEGLSLGLSLAREITRAYRGNLILNSSASGQTTFTLALPIRE
jgi:signal transduction histidine kinase